MRKKYLCVFLPLLAAAVALTALVTVWTLQGSGSVLYDAGEVIVRCALVIGLGTLIGLLLTAKLGRSIDPDGADAPRYDETRLLTRRLEEQRTALRQRRDQLEDREKKLSAITDNMTEGLLLLDGSGVVVLMNTAAAAFLGAVGKPEGRHICTVCDSELLQSAVHAALGGRTSRELLTLGESSIHAVANPVVVDGAVHGAVLMLIDVTERAAAEEMRREFSANVSHELKTPLTSISGYAEMMATGLARSEDVPALAGKIYREAGRMMDLVDDIMKLSRLDEGRVLDNTQRVELLELSREVCRRRADKARGAQVSLTVEGSAAEVTGVPQLIDEMIANLCDNAVKYNRPGGHVWVTAGERDGSPFVNVRDDGIGIAPEHMERIFERFYRVDKSRSKDTGGTGLGLSIVKHAAAWHHASIAADSEPGQGTSISVVFNGKGSTA